MLIVAKHALSRNATFMMNLSANFISQFYMKPLMDAMPYIDIIFGNEAVSALIINIITYYKKNLHNCRKHDNLP